MVPVVLSVFATLYAEVKIGDGVSVVRCALIWLCIAYHHCYKKSRGKDYLRTTLLHLANHGYELDSFSNRGGDRQGVSLQTSSFDELQSLADGKNVLFVRANVAEDA